MDEIKWIEERMGDYSVFQGGGFILEPEDIDLDEWSLWDSDGQVAAGPRAHCEEVARKIWAHREEMARKLLITDGG